MPIANACAVVAVPGFSRRGRWRATTLLLAALSAACGLLPADAPRRAAESRSDPLPFEEAVIVLAGTLLANARLGPPGDNGRHPVVIDPWVDRDTGNQVEATRIIESRVRAMLDANFPQFELLSFDTASLERRPLILVGAVTPAEGQRPGAAWPVRRATAFRVWGVIGDLRTDRVVSQGSVWVQGEGVDIRPAAFFHDSPAWMPDESVRAYLRTADGPIGAPMDPAYLEGLRTSALVADGVRAYEAGRYAEALDSYARARAAPGGEQIRVLNGVYLANVALGRSAAAAAAFRQIVVFGLSHGRLTVKFVFQPNSTAFWPDPAVSGSYGMWLREIASEAAAGGFCLDLIGHASASGSPAGNLRLSRQRARAVRERLVAAEPRLGNALRADGVGVSEPLIGSGADDASDLLDRRVEFRPAACPGSGPGRQASAA